MNIYLALAAILMLAFFVSIVLIAISIIKKQFKAKSLAIPAIIFILFVVVSVITPEEALQDENDVQTETTVEQSTEKEKETTKEETTVAETIFETSTAEETETTEAKTAGVRNESLNGRGNSDTGRQEPEYVNVIGYIATYSLDYDVEQSGTFTETPWVVPIYAKDKQFYVENGTAEHKTEVIVKSQELEHEGWGNYSGYLLVERLDNHEQFYIDVNNFVTKPYWTYNDLEAAALTGNYLAEYNQVSDYYPVDGNGDKVELDDGMIILITGINRDINSIEAYVYKEWTKGYGSVSVFFNPEDLTIIY